MPEVLIDSLIDLQKYREEKESFFKSLTNDPKALKQVENRLDEIIESAFSCPYRPSEVVSLPASNLGTRMEISHEVNAEVDTNVELDLNLELQKELDLHQNILRGLLFPETEWTSQLADNRNNFNPKMGEPYRYAGWPYIYSLKNILMYQQKQISLMNKDYFKLFDENILISHNFAYTYDNMISIFNKKQRYASQILIIKKEEQLKAILISTLEARFFKDYIEQKEVLPSDMWLISSTGAPLAGTAPEETQELKDLLWQVNLFNGNVKALLFDEKTTLQKRKDLDDKLLHDFLALKVEYDPKQKLIFYRSFVNTCSQKKDSISVFRMQVPPKELDDFKRYVPLVNLGIPAEVLHKKSVDVREALLLYKEDIKKFLDAKIDIKTFLNLPFADLVKVLESTDYIIKLLIEDGVQLEVFLGMITPK